MQEKVLKKVTSRTQAIKEFKTVSSAFFSGWEFNKSVAFGEIILDFSTHFF